jgi:hypothetical protein
VTVWSSWTRLAHTIYPGLALAPRGGKDLLLLDVIVVYRLVIVSSRARV